jgi:hypothetical protein
LAVSQPQLEADFGIVVDQRLSVAQLIGALIEQIAERQVNQINAEIFGLPVRKIALDRHGHSSENIL